MSVCFLEHLVRGDDEHGGGGLEAHAALDADDRVADVHVAADAVARADRLHGSDGLHLVGVGFAVHRGDLAPVERDREPLLALGLDLARIGLPRGSVCSECRVSLPPIDVPHNPLLIEYSIFLKSAVKP